METDKAGGVSVMEPIGHAINKTKHILFDPFNLEKWFVIGFCAWLAGLAGGGGGFNFQGNYSAGSSDHTPNMHRIGQDVGAFVSQSLPWLIPLGVVVLFVVLAIAVLVIWLKSRGQFMFLDCIVHNRGAVSAPWTAYKKEGNSLFGFKFVLWLASFVLTVAAVIPLIIIVIAFARTDFKVLLAGPLVGASFLVLGLFLLCLVYGLITVLTDDFVVPVMMLRRCGVKAAWKEFFGMLSANIGRFILYLLVILAAGIALGILSSMIAVAACCCFFCVSWVLVIPIIGGYLFTVLTLPLHVWRRSYAVLFLAQFGEAYNVFALANPLVPQAADVVDFETTDIEPTPAPDEPDNPPSE